VPRLWTSNGTKCMMSDYVICRKKKNQPQIHRLVCETSCRYHVKCKSFNSYKKDRPDIYNVEEKKSKKILKNSRKNSRKSSKKF